MTSKKVQVSQKDKFDCSYCKKCYSYSVKQDFCSCDICETCMKEYFRTRLRKNKVIRNCPKSKDHKIYMDSLLEKPIYRELFIKSKGKVHFMFLTIFIICLICRYFVSIDRCMQIAFSLLLIYHIKADVTPKQKFYFIYAIYIPIAYWFITKNVLEFMQMLSPLHVVWFTCVHLEKDRKTKIKVFIVWISHILWQLLFGFLRYYIGSILTEYLEL